MGPGVVGFFFRWRLTGISYNSAVKIYTRTGDEGDTSLFGGTRVKKDDARVDAYGEIDELNAWLGVVRASHGDASLDEPLVQLQRDLFALGAQVADPGDKIAARVTKAALTDADVARLEQLIDALDGIVDAAGAEAHFKHTTVGSVSLRLASEQPKTSV